MRLAAILVTAAASLWDRLGLVLAASVTWTALVSLPLSADRWIPLGAPPLSHLLVLCLVPLFAALPTAGVFSLAKRIASREEAAYVHLWLDGAARFAPSLMLTLAQSAIAVILGTATMFYAHIAGWIGRVGVVLSLYGVLLWAMMLIYQWPALIAQESGLFDEAGKRAGRGAFAAIRRSFYLALGRPLYTLGLLAILLVLSLVMAVTIVLPALLWIASVAILATTATRGLLVQYGVLPAPIRAEPVPDLQFRLPELGPESRKAESESGPQ